MSYIDDNLITGEEVLYRTRIHKAIFLWSAVFLIMALLCFISGGAPMGLFWLMFAVILGIAAYADYSTAEFGLTNKRVLMKCGVIRRNSVEILLSKIESIQVEQSIIGRLFGYGTVVITGSGGSKTPFPRVDAPFELRKRVQEKLSEQEEQGRV